ncbi:MAG: C13 family peptidase [Vicinamibacteria bacterium]
MNSSPLRVLASWRLCVSLFLLPFLGSAAEAQAKETYLVIIAGIAGDEAHLERFHEASITMREAALTRYGLSADRVFYLGESPDKAPDAIHAKSTKESITALFQKLESTVRPGDQIYVLLVGHGSYDSEEARFNLPGRDLSAADFDALLTPFREQPIVFVNTASASGAFLPVLAKPNRIVVTATKSGFERNETHFGKYFVEAYAGGAGDTDKNERVSVLEAFEYARLRVDGFYQEENLLKTEHAQLDDNGDGTGIAKPGEDSEGDRAGAAYLLGAQAAASGVSPEDLSADPELARLVETQRDLEGRVEALKLQKESLPEDTYLQELERLLLELAAVTQQIEERTNK